MHLRPLGALSAPYLTRPTLPTTDSMVSIAELTARTMDRMADLSLQRGHHAEAERLAGLAAEMREAGR